MDNSKSSRRKSHQPKKPSLASCNLAKIREMVTDGGLLDTLRNERRWVMWKLVSRAGRNTKVPFAVKTGKMAKSTDPTTWSTIKLAMRKLSAGIYDGVGFMLGGGFVGIDLDNCITGTNGDIEEWATKILDRCQTYAEISPSGTGLKLIGLSSSPPEGKGARTGDIEIYHESRFFTVTGNTINDEPVKDITLAYNTLYDEHKKVQIPVSVLQHPPAISVNDAQIVASLKIEIGPLWSGEWSAYKSPSEADLALCYHLALRCGNDMERIDRLFRQSGLYRSKWERQDYRFSTIGKAVCRIAGALPLSEAGNADRLIAQYGDDLIYCDRLGKWFVFDGKLWVEDCTRLIEDYVKRVIRGLRKEAVSIPDKDSAARMFKFALRSDNARPIEAVVRVARSDPSVAVSPDQLDSKPWLLNVENGSIDLRTGELNPHNRLDFNTKISPISFDPKARCPRFRKFLNEIFDGDNQLIKFIQQWFGHCLTGDISEQVVPIFWGDGQNGKNTLLDTIAYVMGDYAGYAPPNLLTSRRNEEHPTEIASLMGRRLIVASETEEGKKLRVQLLKQISGDASITTRKMRQDYFTFQRTFKTILVTNNKPVVSENTHAIWRRLRLIPFTVIFDGHKDDKGLGETLRGEAQGILKWMVKGCLSWLQDGLIVPARVEEATLAYRRAEDILKDFLDDCCEFNPQFWVSSLQLHERYLDWVTANKMRESLSRRAFADRI